MGFQEKTTRYTAHTQRSQGADDRTYPEISSKASRKRVAPRKEILEQNRIRVGFEKKLNRQLMRSFRKVGKQARSEYEAVGGLVSTPRQGLSDIRDILTNHYRAVIEEFGLRMVRDNKQDSQFEMIIRDYINRVGGDRIVNINNTTMQRIRRVISMGEKEGLGVAVIGKNIFDVMSGAFSRSRSATIARTETHNAASFANHQVNASFGIPNQKKRWVSVSDDRTRSHHAQMNGVEVGLDEDFIVNGIPMGYAGDPRGGAGNIINCRCVILYVTPEDEVFVDETTPVAQKPIEQEKPQERLLIGAIIVNKVSDKMRGRFDDKINENLSPLAMSAALNLPRPEQIKNSKKGYYQRQLMLISSDLDSNTLEHEYGHHVDYAGSKTTKFLSVQDKEFQQAFIDDAIALGLGQNGIDFETQVGYQITANKEKLEELRDLISERVTKTKTYTRGRRKGMSFEYQAWQPKFEGGNSISDIIDAMSKGAFYTDLHQWGHGRNYYKRSGSHYYETFANLFAIHGNKKALAEAKKLFPNTIREFERMLKELAEREGN